MIRNLGTIFLCMTFIFATSGNNQGLIFKNLAKSSHELLEMNVFGVPAAEEIFEQVTEKKPPISVTTFPFVSIDRTDISHLNFYLARIIVLHVNDIPVPPPK